MHFAILTSLLALGATALPAAMPEANPDIVAAPAVHLKQATRAQVVKLEQHGTRTKREGAVGSGLPPTSICSAPEGTFEFATVKDMFFYPATGSLIPGSPFNAAGVIECDRLCLQSNGDCRLTQFSSGACYLFNSLNGTLAADEQHTAIVTFTGISCATAQSIGAFDSSAICCDQLL